MSAKVTLNYMLLLPPEIINLIAEYHDYKPLHKTKFKKVLDDIDCIGSQCENLITPPKQIQTKSPGYSSDNLLTYNNVFDLFRNPYKRKNYQNRFYYLTIDKILNNQDLNSKIVNRCKFCHEFCFSHCPRSLWRDCVQELTIKNKKNNQCRLMEFHWKLKHYKLDKYKYNYIRHFNSIEKQNWRKCLNELVALK